MSDFSSEKNVEAIIEAQSLIRKLAGPCPAGEHIKSALRRVSRKLPKWSHNRIRDVWNADKRICIHADELDELRALTARAAEKETTNELYELRERLSRLERLLVSTDEDFHRETIDQVRIQNGRLGADDSAVDREGE